MPEKNQAITNYITNISRQLNEQNKRIMSDEKIQKAIEMFQNSFEILEYIIKKINELAEQAIKNYIEEREKRYNPEHKRQIEKHISSFQQTKSNREMLIKSNRTSKANPNVNSSNGFVDVILLLLFVTFVIGVAVGIVMCCLKSV